MKIKYSIPSYACNFRINYGQGQVSQNFQTFKICQHYFDLWNLGGSFMEYKDADSGEWFPLEEKTK